MVPCKKLKNAPMKQQHLYQRSPEQNSSVQVSGSHDDIQSRDDLLRGYAREVSGSILEEADQDDTESLQLPIVAKPPGGSPGQDIDTIIGSAEGSQDNAELLTSPSSKKSTSSQITLDETSAISQVPSTSQQVAGQSSTGAHIQANEPPPLNYLSVEQVADAAQTRNSPRKNPTKSRKARESEANEQELKLSSETREKTTTKTRATEKGHLCSSVPNSSKDNNDLGLCSDRSTDNTHKFNHWRDRQPDKDAHNQRNPLLAADQQSNIDRFRATPNPLWPVERISRYLSSNGHPGDKPAVSVEQVQLSRTHGGLGPEIEDSDLLSACLNRKRKASVAFAEEFLVVYKKPYQKGQDFIFDPPSGRDNFWKKFDFNSVAPFESNSPDSPSRQDGPWKNFHLAEVAPFDSDILEGWDPFDQRSRPVAESFVLRGNYQECHDTAISQLFHDINLSAAVPNVVPRDYWSDFNFDEFISFDGNGFICEDDIEHDSLKYRLRIAVETFENRGKDILKSLEHANIRALGSSFALSTNAIKPKRGNYLGLGGLERLMHDFEVFPTIELRALLHQISMQLDSMPLMEAQPRESLNGQFEKRYPLMTKGDYWDGMEVDSEWSRYFGKDENVLTDGGVAVEALNADDELAALVLVGLQQSVNMTWGEGMWEIEGFAF